MKKVYRKPEIYFECFQLTSSIAGTCTVTLQEKNTGGMSIFLEDMGTCVYHPADGENGICYDVPTEDDRVFAS